MYPSLKGALILTCAFVLSMGPAAAAEPLRACSLVLAPQTMPGDDGKPQGLAAEVIAMVAPKLDWNISVDFMPWARVVEEAKAGRCDMVLTALKRTDYEEFMVFPREPVLMQSNVLLIRKGARVQYHGDLEAFLRTYSVGLYQDKAVDDQFERLRRAPWARVDLAVDSRRNLQKLLIGRFDAAIENDLTAIHELKRLGSEDKVRILAPPLNVVPAYAAFPRKGRLASEAVRFDRALASIRGSAAYKEIVQKYLGESARP